jgi:hypothetical protein
MVSVPDQEDPMTAATTAGTLRTASVLPATARSVAVMATGLLAGSVLAVWLVQGPLGATGELYIGFRQATDPAYGRVLPPLGVAGMFAALVALATGWSQVRARRLTLAAVGCLVLGLAVTVVVHFPINTEIATWSAVAPPAGWESLRDRWSAAHTARTVLSVAAFALLLGAARAEHRAPVTRR